MSESVKMPALGESVTEGTVTRWLKEVGESVEVDEPLLEVATDKVDTEIPSPVAGVLEKILVGEDETVAVGAELAIIGSGEGGGEQAQAAEPKAEAEPAPEPTPESEPAQEPTPEPEPSAPAPRSGSGGGGGGQAVTLPALGESVSEGTVTRWLKEVGESVEVDEPLLEVSTDKVDTEIPSPVAGVLTKILVGEDETVAVGTELALIGSAEDVAAPAPAAPAEEAPAPGEKAPSGKPAAIPEAVAEAEAEAEAPAESAPSEEPSAPAPAPSAAATYVTPLVRKLATEKGVDLSAVTGTGVGGRVRKEDVIAAAEKAAAEKAAAEKAAKEKAAAEKAPAAQAKAAPPAPSPLRGTRVKMTRLRKIVAERMVQSMQTTAQLTTVVEVDVTRVAALRAKAKATFEAREGAKLTFLPFFVLAATEALKAHPKINASIEGEEIVYHAEENIGLAVDTERGLVVPVIRGAGDLNIGGIARKIVDLAARTRSNKIGPDELSGATFTITNTGSGGALIDTPIVPAPQVAILGTGTIVKRPVVAKDADGNEVIAIRSMMYLFLSYDHQLVDGADAARFLMTVKARIEAGAFEADLGL